MTTDMTIAEARFLRLLEEHFKADKHYTDEERQVVNRMRIFLNQTGEMTVPEIGLKLEEQKEEMLARAGYRHTTWQLNQQDLDEKQAKWEGQHQKYLAELENWIKQGGYKGTMPHPKNPGKFTKPEIKEPDVSVIQAHVSEINLEEVTALAATAGLKKENRQR